MVISTWFSFLFALVVGGVLALGPASAQDVKPSTSESQEATATAVKAASDAAKGKSDTSKDFMSEQAKRAAKIRAEASKDSKSAEFYKQRKAVEAATADNGEWARRQLERAQKIGTATIDEAAAQAGMGPDKPKRPQYIVFLSQSMGDAALAEAFEIGRGKTNVGYSFIGFLKDQTPLQFQTKMMKFQGKTEDKLFQLQLDPPSFEAYSIESVPAIVRIDTEDRLSAKVSGLINYGWLRDRVEAGDKGDLGVRGKVYPIAEINLIDQMKAKAAAFDWKKESEGAADRFFRGLETIDLPYATEQRARKVIPEVNVSEDIVDQKGVVRYRKGDRISLKEELARAPVIIVFNSQDSYHVAFAKTMVKKAPPNRKVILLTTRVDREAGIPGYARQEFAIGTPVYLLMENVRSTFGIEKIPTVVTPGENEFIVVEVPLKQGVSGNASSHTP